MFTTLYINFSDAQGQITLELVVVVSGRKVELIQTFMNVLVTCKNENDRFKSEGCPPQSLVRSSRILNSFEMLWKFSLPASMKKIRLKTKALECL